MPVPHDQPEYRVYLWNVTNVGEMKNERAKPKIEQIGPICFDFEIDSEFTIRNDSATYAFKQTFHKRECGGGIPSVPYDSLITHLNLPYVMTKNALKEEREGSRRYFEKMFAKNWTLFAEHTVKELLHGYSDPTWQNFISNGVETVEKFGYLFQNKLERKEINVPIEDADETFAVNWRGEKKFIPLGESILPPDFLSEFFRLIF